jgi:hypothetical protein
MDGGRADILKPERQSRQRDNQLVDPFKLRGPEMAHNELANIISKSNLVGRRSFIRLP